MGVTPIVTAVYCFDMKWKTYFLFSALLLTVLSRSELCRLFGAICEGVLVTVKYIEMSSELCVWPGQWLLSQ
jgi:hypothetical protein